MLLDARDHQRREKRWTICVPPASPLRERPAIIPLGTSPEPGQYNNTVYADLSPVANTRPHLQKGSLFIDITGRTIFRMKLTASSFGEDTTSDGVITRTQLDNQRLKCFERGYSNLAVQIKSRMWKRDYGCAFVIDHS